MRLVLPFLFLLLLAFPAAAQSLEGPYVSGGIGIDQLDSMRATDGRADIGTDPGPAGHLALGWRFENGLRAEIEGGARSANIDKFATLRLSGQRLPLNDIQGSVLIPSIMGNLLYDIDLDLVFGPEAHVDIRPYIGGGIGFGWLDLDGAGGSDISVISLPGHNTFVGPTAIRYHSGSAVAYQAIAGAAVPIDSVPGLEATLEYRFFGMTRAEVTATAQSTANILVNGSVPTASRRSGFTPEANTILVGFRYQFDRP